LLRDLSNDRIEMREKKSLISRLLAGAGILLVVFAFSVSLWSQERWVVDDALIYQNYVRSFLDGRGLAYSGTDQVEGFSSPLWLALITSTGSILNNGYQTTKLTGAMLGMVLVLLLLFLPGLKINILPRFLAAGLLAVSMGFATWSGSGMEGPLIALLMFLIFYSAISGKIRFVSTAAGLLAISRPESVLYTLVVLVWIGFYNYRDMTRKHKTINLLLLFGPLFLLHIFRFFYFGTLVSNSALAKLTSAARIDDEYPSGFGFHYLIRTLFDYPGIAVFSIAMVLLMIYQFRKINWNRNDLLAVALISTTAIFILCFKGDWMPFARFSLPIIPLTLAWIVFRWDSFSENTRNIGIVMAVLGICLNVYQFRNDTVPNKLRNSWEATWNSVPMIPGAFRSPIIGDTGTEFHLWYLLKYTHPGEFVIFQDIGQIGYFVSDLNILDSFGLVTRFECEYFHGRHTDQELRNHFASKNPSVIFSTCNRSDGKINMGAILPIEDILNKKYTLIATRNWYTSEKIKVFVRKDCLSREPDIKRYKRLVEQSPGMYIGLKPQ